jgi:PKD repeat protein
MAAVRILLLAVMAVLASVAPAAAVPTPNFSFSPTTPTVGQTVTFTPSTTGSAPGAMADWDFQNDNVLDVIGAPVLQAVTHAYSQAGTFQVRMVARDITGAATLVKPIRVNAPPVSQFAVSPTTPVTGEEVRFRSFSYDPGGSPPALVWDTDGDGFDDGTGETATRTFASAGGRLVGLRVTDSDGVSHTSFQTINVTANEVASAGLSLMNPFPVVRLAGSVFPRGVRVRALEAKTPRRATVTVLCAGKSCPAKKIVKTAKKRLVRFKAMTKFLRAGTLLSVSIRKGGQIGKYTRWRIRGGKLPKRTDRCLYPNRRKPVRCPQA